INGYAPTFSGNIIIAGPQGLALQPSASLNLNAADNNINNLTVNGIQTLIGGKNVSVAQNLIVGDNAGTVVNGLNGVTTGSTPGALSIPNTGTLTAARLRNDGIIGSTGGAATINVTGQVQGRGLFQTSGQDLAIAHTRNTPVAANDAHVSTLPKLAGNNIVPLNPPRNRTHTRGLPGHSGPLRLAPPAP